MPNTNSETSKSQKQDFLEEVDKKPAKKEKRNPGGKNTG